MDGLHGRDRSSAVGRNGHDGRGRPIGRGDHLLQQPRIDNPQGITAGPDGAVWFANTDGSSIGRISATGQFTFFTGGGYVSRPQDVITGPDGALWYTDYGQNAIGRMTTSGKLTLYTDSTYPYVYDPGAITVGPDGALWFTNGEWIGRITTAGNITLYTTPGLTTGFGITAGPDGALWFTGYADGVNATYFGRITTSGKITTFKIPGTGASLGITASDGALWFADDGIVRVDTNGTTTRYRTTESNSASVSGVWGITNGPDGALWWANNGDWSIGRFTVPPAVPNAPVGVSAAPSGSNALVVSFIAGESIGPAETAFAATCISSDGGATRTARRAGASAAPITVTSVNTKKTYRCTATAMNANGTSAPSAASAPVIVGAPSQPGKPSVSRLGSGHLKVSFAAPANNGAPITSFKAVCRSSNGGTTRGKKGSAGPLGVKALTPGKHYACTVVATNSRGAGRASPESAPVTA